MDKDGKTKMFNFFATRNNKLKNYVQRKIQSISDMDAEDIVAEVMLNIFVKADILDPVENLAAYVYRSLHNKVVDYLRKKTRTVSLYNCTDENGDIPMIDRISNNAMSIGGEAERREVNRRLAQAIGRLEPKQRAVFIATEIQGMTFRELSEQWNEPMGTLLSRKCRAAKALQEMLKDLKAE